MIASGVLGARVVGGHDHDVGELGCDLPHQRALSPVAVSPGAEDDDDAPAPEPARRAEHRRERVRRVRVVDDDRERLPSSIASNRPGTSGTLAMPVAIASSSRSSSSPAATAPRTFSTLKSPRSGVSISIPPRGTCSRAGRARAPPAGSRHRRRARTSRAARGGRRQLVGEPPPHSSPTFTAAGGGCGAREEPPLRLEVLLHRPVQVEVVLAQVREDERVEADAVEAAERRSVRASPRRPRFGRPRRASRGRAAAGRSPRAS